MMTRITRRLAAGPALGLLIACAVLGGCSMAKKAQSAPTEEKLIIPNYPTAKDQYNFARVYQNSQVRTSDKTRRDVQLDKAIQAYRKVLEVFPNDEQFAPLAMMNIGDCVGMKKDYRGAREVYAEAAARWPHIELIQARTAYSTARTMDQEQRFEDGKAVYKKIMEQYGNSQDPAVRQIAKLSAENYYRLRTEPAKGSAAKKPARR